jgi:hypothetical protein
MSRFKRIAVTALAVPALAFGIASATTDGATGIQLAQWGTCC